MEKALKFGVIFFLLAATFSLPKEFQELTRFILISLFGILAYNAHVEANIKGLGLYLALIILYQPFVIIPLEPIVFKVLNGLIAALIAFTIMKPLKKIKKALN